MSDLVQCFDVISDNMPKEISGQANCKLIPKQITFFCRELFKQVSLKFPERSESIISEFLFDRWLLKALCDEGNKNGLVKNSFLVDDLHKNLSLVKDALSSLVSTRLEFEVAVYYMPAPISEICLQRRYQAVRFMKDFLTPTEETPSVN